MRIDEKMSEVRVLDESNEVWFTEIYMKKFKWLREGQVVMIKNAFVNDQQLGSKQLSLSYSSNILTMPSDSKIAREMTMDEKGVMIEADRFLLQNAIDGKIAH